MATRFSIWQGPPANAEVYKSLKIVFVDSAGSKPVLQVWRGKARKPFVHYSFPSEAARLAYLDQVKASEDSQQAHKADHKQKKVAGRDKLAAEIQVGTILNYSWGYDQTNQDFFQVVERFGKYGVKIREIGYESVPGSDKGGMSDQVVPVKDAFVADAPVLSKIITSQYGIPMDHGAASPVGDRESFYRSWYA